MLHGIAWGKGWRIFGMPMIQRHRGSQIELGDNLELRSWRSSNPLAPNHAVVLATRTAAATIRIGKGCGFTGTTIVAAESITIGDRVLVGANSTIVDTDFHPLDPVERQRDILNGQHAAITIEDDVFIGMNCLILKGVTIGRGSVVGAGSVVTRSVPPGVIVAGNPAQVVREL
jgi:acetyltransferase-like isoleucine patch superfamily enzyme